MGSRMRSNFARIAFFSCSRRVPFLSCTSSSFGRLMAIVFAPALACPATYTTSYALRSASVPGRLALVLLGHRDAALQRRKHRARTSPAARLHAWSLTSTNDSSAAL